MSNRLTQNKLTLWHTAVTWLASTCTWFQYNLRSTQPPTLSRMGISISLCATRWRPGAANWGGGVSAGCTV